MAGLIPSILTGSMYAILLNFTPVKQLILMIKDDNVQYAVNCPAAPTRNDREVGENVNINMTLFDALMSYTKDNETLSLEDLAEHHFMRIAQSRQDNPSFIYGNQGAICSLYDTSLTLTSH